MASFSAEDKNDEIVQVGAEDVNKKEQPSIGQIDVNKMDHQISRDVNKNEDVNKKELPVKGMNEYEFEK